MEEFVKDRSVRNCISIGYNFWQEHLIDTFKKTKWRLLFNSLMLSLAVTSYLLNWNIFISIAFLSLSFTNINVKARQIAHGMEIKIRGKKLIGKNFAYYFSFLLHAAIINLAIGLMAFTPALLLGYMYFSDSEAVKMGDPSTITTSFWVLLGASIFVATVITEFVETIFAYAELYVCGTMVIRSRAKRSGK